MRCIFGMGPQELTGTIEVVDMICAPRESTLWLISSASAGREIYVSNDGFNFEIATYSVNASTAMVDANGNAASAKYVKRAVLYSGVKRVLFKGVAGDAYGVD